MDLQSWGMGKFSNMKNILTISLLIACVFTGAIADGFNERGKKDFGHPVEAFEKEKNLVVWKATRAGVTTSMIRIAVEKGQKLLVVVPTNRIGKTKFPETLKIVKNDIETEVNGAILASNRKGCLLLNIVGP